MFVLSLRNGKIKKIAVLICALSLSVAGIMCVVKFSGGSSSTLENGAISLRASNDDERVSFFSQFGWKIDEEPKEVKEIIIPEEFDEEYGRYNEIQKQQDLDLKDYRSCRAKIWTYNVKNYPGYENVDGVIEGNIIVYDGAVIAGDISCLENDNQFVKTLDFPETQVTKNGEINESKN